LDSIDQSTRGLFCASTAAADALIKSTANTSARKPFVSPGGGFALTGHSGAELHGFLLPL
jgi:hypothetical protein